MSIYAAWVDIRDDNHELHCARWRRATEAEASGSAEYAVDVRDRYYVPVAGAACTCGEQGPIVYQGSHVNPSDNDQRGGFVMVCAIPNHCHPDARGTDSEGAPVDFLRLSVREDSASYRFGETPGDATVVLTKQHVVELRDTLQQWLDAEERA